MQVSTGGPAAGTAGEAPACTAGDFEGTGAGRPHLVYLTFEGVLHSEQYALGRARQRHFENTSEGELFEHSSLLSNMLGPYPSVRIVLSTSWVHEFGFAVSLAQLPRQLQDRVIGCTEHAAGLFPGQQVAADVQKRTPASWLALEVDPFGWPQWCLPHLVVCDPNLGISRPDVRADLEARLAEIGRGAG